MSYTPLRLILAVLYAKYEPIYGLGGLENEQTICYNYGNAEESFFI